MLDYKAEQCYKLRIFWVRYQGLAYLKEFGYQNASYDELLEEAIEVLFYNSGYSTASLVYDVFC